MSFLRPISKRTRQKILIINKGWNTNRVIARKENDLKNCRKTRKIITRDSRPWCLTHNRPTYTKHNFSISGTYKLRMSVIARTRKGWKVLWDHMRLIELKRSSIHVLFFLQITQRSQSMFKFPWTYQQDNKTKLLSCWKDEN